jgi:hypothetical protein
MCDVLCTSFAKAPTSHYGTVPITPRGDVEQSPRGEKADFRARAKGHDNGWKQLKLGRKLFHNVYYPWFVARLFRCAGSWFKMGDGDTWVITCTTCP